MKIEKQVCSLELAKKLEKLKVKQDSLFYWKHHWVGKEVDEWSLVYGKGEERNYEDWGINYISAFTVAELGEMLPERIYKRSDKNKRHKVIAFFEEFIDEDMWSIIYKPHNEEDGIVCCPEDADTEANARAKMIIYLIENKLLK